MQLRVLNKSLMIYFLLASWSFYQSGYSLAANEEMSDPTLKILKDMSDFLKKEKQYLFSKSNNEVVAAQRTSGVKDRQGSGQVGLERDRPASDERGLGQHGVVNLAHRSIGRVGSIAVASIGNTNSSNRNCSAIGNCIYIIADLNLPAGNIQNAIWIWIGINKLKSEFSYTAAAAENIQL